MDVKVAVAEEMLEGSQSIVVRNVRVQGGNVQGKQEAPFLQTDTNTMSWQPNTWI